MAQIFKSIKDITSKDLVYDDNFFNLTYSKIKNDNCFDFNAYEILKNAEDVKTNNYSNLVLTKKRKNSEVLNWIEKEDENQYDFVTTLSFCIDEKELYLCFNKGFNDVNTLVDSSSLTITEGKPANYFNYLFRVNCLDDTNCNISYNFGDTTFYITENKGLFSLTETENKEFLYRIKDNNLLLFKKKDDGLYKVACVKDITGKNYILSLRKYEKEINSDEIITISEDNLNFNYYVDSSWVKYDRSQYINAVDSKRSDMHLKSQFLFHHEYNNDNAINILPLKNNLTYQGSVVSGNNLYQPNDAKKIEYPLVDYRNYTAIHSGLNQEYGNDAITLSFSFTDQEFKIKEGEDLFFTIPEGDNDKSEIYPYKKLNVNDTQFVKNGSFASDVPYFADKFYKLQNKNYEINNGTYLCTWLYQSDSDNEAIWLDRYYYPDKTTRFDTLGENPVFKDNSFNNIIDTYYSSSTSGEKSPGEVYDLDNFNDNLEKLTYVDKKSDVTIAPGCSYKYSRISNDMVKEVFDKISDNRIEFVNDQNNSLVEFDNLYNFDGGNWLKITPEKFNKSSAINLNTNIYINPDKKIGIQLFGSDYKRGFNIQNRKDLVPFHYYATENKVYWLNNKFEIIKTLDVTSKYEETICQLVIGDVFEDVALICENSIIILEYDLKLKYQVEYSKIAGLNDLGIKSGGEISSKRILLHNYNLYFINDNNIIKIIFLADSSNDIKPTKVANDSTTDANDSSTDTDDSNTDADSAEDTNSSNSVVFARVLEENEFFDNITVANDDAIKTLYIDENNNLYAFNYDQLTMSPDGDTIYGIYDTIDENLTSYLYNQSLGKLYAATDGSNYAEFYSTDVSIDRVAFNKYNEFGLIRGFTEIKKDENDDHYIVEKDKCLEIYNRNKTKIFSYPLEKFDKIIAFDSYTYINEMSEEITAFSFLGVKNNVIVQVEFQSENQKFITRSTKLPVNCLKNYYQSINSNSLINKNDENCIYFNLYLPTNYIYYDCVTFKWDLKDAQEGWYNINVAVDLNESKFKIKINENIFAEYDPNSHDKFLTHYHSDKNIFNVTYFFGCVGKYYGKPLNDILKNAKDDPYAIKNCKIENSTIYNKSLKYYEYQATRLNYTKINDLVITLPCGIRNGIEEIVRYFKYNKPNSISNKVKLNISGISDWVVTEDDAANLKKEISAALNNQLDCLTSVKEIAIIK